MTAHLVWPASCHCVVQNSRSCTSRNRVQADSNGSCVAGPIDGSHDHTANPTALQKAYPGDEMLAIGDCTTGHGMPGTEADGSLYHPGAVALPPHVATAHPPPQRAYSAAALPRTPPHVMAQYPQQQQHIWPPPEVQQLQVARSRSLPRNIWRAQADPRDQAHPETSRHSPQRPQGVPASPSTPALT